MAIIQKRADELKPGDILRTEGPSNRVVLAVTNGSNCIGTYAADLGRPSHEYPVPPFPNMPDAVFDVVVPDAVLTPPQQFADDLFGLVREASIDPARVTPAWLVTARKLVDKISPPEPPTLAETLAVLEHAAKWANLNVDNLDEDDRVACDASEKNLCAVLDRARRAGLLPKGGA